MADLLARGGEGASLAPAPRSLKGMLGDALKLPSKGEASIAFWRERIVGVMVLAGAVAGFFVYVPSVLLCLKVHLWSVAVVDTLAYGWVVAAAFSPRMTCKARAWGFLVMDYAIALALLVRIPSVGAGLLWLTALPVLAAILLGLRPAVMTWALSAATLAACTVAAALGVFGSQSLASPMAFDVGAWIVNSTNALFISAVVALPTALLLRGLEHAHNASREAEAERHRLETELLHAQKLESLGSLAGGVAHDMNNILAAILGLASTLQAKHPGDDPLQKPLGIILDACERGRKLVSSLTAFARKELQDARPVDLNELVRKEIEILGSTTRQKIQLMEDLDPALPAVLGEPSALANALMNLCVNAVDAMPGGGVLGFRTRVGASGEVELTLSDTGHGMAPEILARAMEPFFTTKPVGKGTGLGLAGVYGTIKAHGGTVELRSAAGEGTRVILRFPPYAALAADPGAAPDAREAQARPMRILLVDDDAIIQETVPAMLQFLGHSVMRASRGQEALDLLGSGLPVDLVILDHNMPGMNGTDTLGLLKTRFPDLPVILSTGFLEPELEDKVRQGHRTWLLPKPFSLVAVREALGRVADDEVEALRSH